MEVPTCEFYCKWGMPVRPSETMVTDADFGPMLLSPRLEGRRARWADRWALKSEGWSV